MASPSLPAMNVPSPYAGPAMNTREEREIKCVLSVRPDTGASKVQVSLHSLMWEIPWHPLNYLSW